MLQKTSPKSCIVEPVKCIERLVASAIGEQREQARQQILKRRSQAYSSATNSPSAARGRTSSLSPPATQEKLVPLRERLADSLRWSGHYLLGLLLTPPEFV